jgi:hypothetical protein
MVLTPLSIHRLLELSHPLNLKYIVTVGFLLLFHFKKFKCLTNIYKDSTLKLINPKDKKKHTLQVNNWLNNHDISETRSFVCTITHDNISHHYTKLMYVGWRSSLRKNYHLSQFHVEVILVHCCRPHCDYTFKV